MKFVTVGLAAALLSFGAHAQGCKTKVAVGGISGFADLAEPSNTERLRACNSRLYLHWYAWRTLPDDKRQAVLSLFKGAGDPIIEIDMPANPEAYFHGDFVKLFSANGVTSHEAHINYFHAKHPFSEWTRFVDAGRAAGLSVMAPIYTPNNGQYHMGAFPSPMWDNVRKAALYGGGLSLDLPSDVFLARGPDYQRFAVDEIRWANAHHLLSTVIVSPGKSGAAFLADTKILVTTLHGAAAEPSQYVVENYEPHPPASYLNGVGSDRSHGTVAAVALWIALHR